MSESIKHMELVEKAKQYMEKIVPSEYKDFIKVDSPSECYKPENLYDGFKPDLLYSYENLLAIGEAKTLKDFERTHSFQQFDSYFKYCDNFVGDSFIVISVPWQLQKTAKNYFSIEKRKRVSKTTIIIINDLNDFIEKI